MREHKKSACRCGHSGKRTMANHVNISILSNKGPDVKGV